MKSTHLFLIAVVAACSAAMTGAVQAQEQPAAPRGAEVVPPSMRTPHAAPAGATQDRKFMEDAAHAGAFEIEASKLALQRKTTLDVRTFAQRMVDDHERVAEELRALADRHGVRVSNEPSVPQKAKLKILKERRGGFERAYVDEVAVSAHEDAVKLFEKASHEATEPDVKAFAQKVLPQLQHHLSLGKDLKRKLAAGARKSH